MHLSHGLAHQRSTVPRPAGSSTGWPSTHLPHHAAARGAIPQLAPLVTLPRGPRKTREHAALSIANLASAPGEAVAALLPRDSSSWLAMGTAADIGIQTLLRELADPELPGVSS